MSARADDRGDTHSRAWRRLPDSNEDMGWQLAHTDALFAGLEADEAPAIRWFVPTQPALVLGRSQGPQRADLAAARAAGVAVYRRTSGGGAVFIDQNALSLDVALPASHPLLTRDVTLSYRWIGEVWEQALAAIGIRGVRTIATEEVRAIPALAADDPLRLACYGTLSPWEVVAGRRKVVGLSQIRRRAGAVYAIGVHLHWNPERLVALLALPADTRRSAAAALGATAVGLDELASRPVAVSEVVAAIERALEARLGVRLAQSEWLHGEQEAAARLASDQYQPLA